MSPTQRTHDQTYTSFFSPVSEKSDTPQKHWTPSAWTDINDSAEEGDVESDPRSPAALTALNEAMQNLSQVASVDSPDPVAFQLNKSWEEATEGEKEECISKAAQASRLICNIIAPQSGEILYQSLPHDKPVSQDLETLMKAYASAPTRNLRTQILSIYAYDYPIKKLQSLHEPYIKLTEWQIKRARAHAKARGPGLEVIKTRRHRISLDMQKVDHFVDFVNRPYFHQDVAFGTRKLKLESGEIMEMPNVIRTVNRSTMIAQYQAFCKEQSFEPLSRSTLYRILEVREASEGLDNTAANGSGAFQTLKSITQQLVNVGVDKSWSDSMEKRLDRGKQYIKTNYKVHCREHNSPCADHCRFYGLSDPQDKDFQSHCTHKHDMPCESCEDLRSIMDGIEKKIRLHYDRRFSEEYREDLIHDFQEAKSNILLWKAHVMRSVNQELAKEQALHDLDESSILLVIDWAMKFLQIRFREKQSDWYEKRDELAYQQRRNKKQGH